MGIDLQPYVLVLAPRWSRMIASALCQHIWATGSGGGCLLNAVRNGSVAATWAATRCDAGRVGWNLHSELATDSGPPTSVRARQDGSGTH